MSHSIVSSMVLFLILLLVFPRMDTALTTHTEVNKPSGANGEEKTHPDQVRVQPQGRGKDIAERIAHQLPHFLHKLSPPPRQP